MSGTTDPERAGTITLPDESELLIRVSIDQRTLERVLWMLLALRETHIEPDDLVRLFRERFLTTHE